MTIMIVIHTPIYIHIVKIVKKTNGLLISLFLLLSCIICVVMTTAGALLITSVSGDVSITSGSHFTGNRAFQFGGMYGCDEDW